MTRQVSATITDVTKAAREGLLVFFFAPSGTPHVTAMTDASGVFRVDLEPLIPYRVSVENAVIVDGQSFAAGIIFQVIVPEGEGPVSLDQVDIQFIDASRPAILDRIALLESRILALEGAQ